MAKGSSEATVQVAVDRFLASARCRNPNTRRSYAGVLDRLGERLGADRRLDKLTGEELAEALHALWGVTAASTWNQRRAAVASWLAWCAKNGYPVPALPDAAERRSEAPDETRALDRAAVERLLTRRDVPLREKTLWRMLYETAARAGEILALDVGDLDLAARRAAIVSKGGAVEYVYWATGTAHLLPRLLGGRTVGPVFLSLRRPGPARRPAAKDLCPETGRARLGYDRARVLLDRYTSAGPGMAGWDLRHALRQARRSGGGRGHRAARHRPSTTLTPSSPPMGTAGWGSGTSVGLVRSRITCAQTRTPPTRTPGLGVMPSPSAGAAGRQARPAAFDGVGVPVVLAQ